MVFSFFKKQPQKMPDRPSARPRSPLPEIKPASPPPPEPPVALEPLPDLEFTRESPPPAAPAAAPAPARMPAERAAAGPLPGIDPAFSIDEFDDDFTESSVMAIDVAHDIDPLQADVEQVVVLFANGQDAAARSLLEGFIKAYPADEGRRLWLLLFDLLQVFGDRAAFDKLCVEFAQACETSPPTWREEQCFSVRATPAGGVLALQGVLTADDLCPVQQFDRLLKQTGELLLDCSKLVGCDDAVAGQLADRLIGARRVRKVLRVVGAEGLLRRLDERLTVGEPSHEPSWRLLLELLQRVGEQAHFEERAIDYAVTFERSPPSWEVMPAPGKTPLAPREKEDVFFLCGDLKNQRFDDLAEFAGSRAQPVIDFSGVRRLDFFSAGQLVNRLAPLKAGGKEIVIRSPNHLVAELMAVVGLNKQARIIVPKS